MVVKSFKENGINELLVDTKLMDKERAYCYNWLVRATVMQFRPKGKTDRFKDHEESDLDEADVDENNSSTTKAKRERTYKLRWSSKRTILGRIRDEGLDSSILERYLPSLPTRSCFIK